MAPLEIAGRRIEARWLHGEPATRALVFLHHGLGSVATWRDFPARLAAAVGIPAFAYSRLGHGASDPASEKRGLDYVHSEARDTLPRVFAAAGIGAPILVGHSDGGTIALIHAAEPGSAVSGVIAEAPHIFVEERTVEGIRAARREFAEGGMLAALERHHGDKAEALFRAWADTWLDPAFRNWNCEDCLPAIRCPVQLIQGIDDAYGTARQIERIRAAVSARAELHLIAQCGHDPHREKADDVLALMAEFVRGLD